VILEHLAQDHLQINQLHDDPRTAFTSLSSGVQANVDARRPVEPQSFSWELEVQANVDANHSAAQQMLTHLQANHDAPNPICAQGDWPAAHNDTAWLCMPLLLGSGLALRGLRVRIYH